MIDPARQPRIGRPRSESDDIEAARLKGYIDLIDAILTGNLPLAPHRGAPVLTETQRIAWMQEHCPGALEWLQERAIRCAPPRPSPRGMSRPDRLLGGS